MGKAIRVGQTFSEPEVDALQKVLRAAVEGRRVEPYAIPGFSAAYRKVVSMKASCERMHASVASLDAALSGVRNA